MILLLGNRAQDSPKQEIYENHPQQLLDKKSKPIRLNVKETEQNVLHGEVPRLRYNVCAQGTIVVMVLIDPEGKVICTHLLVYP